MSELPMTKGKPSARAQLEGVATVTTRSPEKLTHYTERRDIVERLLQPMSNDPSAVQRERYLAAQEITRLRAQPGPQERDIVERIDAEIVTCTGEGWLHTAKFLSEIKAEITRLRAQPGPREAALEKAIRTMRDHTGMMESARVAILRLTLKEIREEADRALAEKHGETI